MRCVLVVLAAFLVFPMGAAFLHEPGLPMNGSGAAEE
jgi:hypothetical protein